MDVALAMLGRRSHPASAVRSRIAGRFGDEEAERVVARLLVLGVLDDAKYAEAFVRDRFRRAGYGRRRIRADLVRRGVAPAAVDAALGAIVDDQAERERAKQALARFTRLRAGRKEGMRLRDAAFRHLIGRGFPGDLVRDLLSGSR
jgi:regulatory protein